MTDVHLTQAPVRSNREIARKIYELQLEAPQIAGRFRPGQFINIQTNPDGAPLWRRPFSIARTDGQIITIIYKALGLGTHQMAAWHPGDAADIIGPLGNSFMTDLDPGVQPLLIGGGLGFAPLIILRDVFVQQGFRPTLFMGAMTAEEHYYTEDEAAELFLTSDDGTLGTQGLVIDALKEYLDGKADRQSQFYAYSCGPEPMMAHVTRICRSLKIPVELSIEREMACGIGLCQGCVIEQKPPHKKYALVCKDGPVFDGSHLTFTDQ